MPCAGNVPIIVASGSFNPTGNLAASTIYTPSVAGLYRISVYVTPFTSGSISPIWTDVNGKTQNGNLDHSCNGYLATATWTFNADASTNIQMSTNAMGSNTYTLYYTLEQLA